MPETPAETKRRAKRIVGLLRTAYPEVRCMLNFSTTHELMVAVILSAQCTDKRVNQITPELFKKYRSIEDFAHADCAELEQLVRPAGYGPSKARYIQESARFLLERHNGAIPQTLEELVKLPGVGRKTGSVILGVGFGLAEGIVVDTHVMRLSRRLGFTRQSDAVRIERDLMAIIPKADWIDFSHLLIFHGRATCTARKPQCDSCALARLCPSAFVVDEKKRSAPRGRSM